MIAIEGHSATKENIDLAWTLGKPLLPVPCTGGNARDAWDQYGYELKQTLRLSRDEIRILEGSLDDPQNVADCCVTILRRMIRPRCFVAMKFGNHPAPWAYRVIEAMAEKRCHEPVRVDKLPGIGSIVDTIWLGIRSSDAFVADITGNSPNVFYELGIAHALQKDVVILLHSLSRKLPKNPPFDIQGHRINVYWNEASLRVILERELNHRHS